MGYAAQISFYMLVSLIPLLIMLAYLLSQSGLIDMYGVLSLMRESRIFPDSALTLIESMFQGVTMPTQSLPIYAALVIWFASRGIRAIMNAIHMTFRTRDHFSIPVHFALSFLYTILFVVMVVLFTVLVIYGDKLFTLLSEALGTLFFVSYLAQFIRYLIPLGFLFVLYTAMYRVIPGKDLATSDVLPGSIAATIASFVVSQIFSVFATQSTTNYSAIYGGLSGIAIICTWMWLFSLVLILGSELNACVYEVKNDTTLVSIY